MCVTSIGGLLSKEQSRVLNVLGLTWQYIQEYRTRFVLRALLYTTRRTNIYDQSHVFEMIETIL